MFREKRLVGTARFCFLMVFSCCHRGQARVARVPARAPALPGLKRASTTDRGRGRDLRHGSKALAPWGITDCTHPQQAERVGNAWGWGWGHRQQQWCAGRRLIISGLKAGNARTRWWACRRIGAPGSQGEVSFGQRRGVAPSCGERHRRGENKGGGGNGRVGEQGGRAAPPAEGRGARSSARQGAAGRGPPKGGV